MTAGSERLPLSYWVALGVIVAVQVGAAWPGGYLDGDDAFVLRMGQAVASAGWGDRLEQLATLWTSEPTWRPLSTARAGVEFALFGGAAAPRLVTNALLHLASSVLIARCAVVVGSGTVRAAVASLVFAAFPLHSEALAWPHSGFEGMTVTAPLLLWALAWLRGRHRLALLWFGLATLTRENAACVSALVFLVPTAGSHRSRWAWLLAYAGVLALHVAVRVALTRAAGHGTAGSFHWVESPQLALLAALGWPLMPVHPAVAGAGALRVVAFVLLAATVVGLAWRRPLRRGTAVVLATMLPFLPQYHDAWRFVSAAEGGFELRWYFFHLPLAASAIWLALALPQSVEGARAKLVVAVTLAALLALCVANERVWREGTLTANRVAAALAAHVGPRCAPLELTTVSETDADEVASQVVLNADVFVGADASRCVRCRRLRDGRLERAVSTGLAHVEWQAASGCGVARRMHWDALTQSLRVPSLLEPTTPRDRSSPEYPFVEFQF